MQRIDKPSFSIDLCARAYTMFVHAVRLCLFAFHSPRLDIAIDSHDSKVHADCYRVDLPTIHHRVSLHLDLNTISRKVITLRQRHIINRYLAKSPTYHVLVAPKGRPIMFFYSFYVFSLIVSQTPSSTFFYVLEQFKTSNLSHAVSCRIYTRIVITPSTTPILIAKSSRPDAIKTMAVVMIVAVIRHERALKRYFILICILSFNRLRAFHVWTRFWIIGMVRIITVPPRGHPPTCMAPLASTEKIAWITLTWGHYSNGAFLRQSFSPFLLSNPHE